MSIYTTNKSTKTQVIDFKKKINIYIHYPFCLRKCNYCAFYSVAGQETKIPLYQTALVREVASLSESLAGYLVQTIYIGGGTPSLLKAAQIDGLITSIRKYLSVAKDVEITLEANPDSLSKRKLVQYKQAGINRLSLGLQTWQDHLLVFLGRSYTHTKFKQIFQCARQVGFDNINVDCIFGFPTQTLKDWQLTLNKVIELSPEHIACYSLELDNNSLFGHLNKRGLLPRCDEILDRNMYHFATKHLKDGGYIHYEISNFAKPGYDCRHNSDFWHQQPYRGLGSGSHSYFNNTHYRHSDDLLSYIKDPLAIDDLELSPQLRRSEWIYLHLRLIRGISYTDYGSIFHTSILEDFTENIATLESLKLIKRDTRSVRCTPKGLDLFDSVTSLLLS